MQPSKFTFWILNCCAIAMAWAQQEVPLTLHISSSTPTQKEVVFKVFKNDWINLNVDSDLPGELHLHAYRLSLPLQANELQSLRFQAKSTGKFKLEWHPLKSVNDTSAKKGHAHAPPLASIEVLPR